MTIKLALPLIALIACTALPASAQKMYRCGSVYQDHPCGGGQEGKVIGHGSGSNTDPGSSQSALKVDAQCAQRGAAAQKIKWIRESGSTQQQQEAAAGADRALIADVYGRQGTSGEVRAAVEADCMAQKERAARAAALLEAAGKGSVAPQGGKGQGEPVATPTAGTTAPPQRDNAGPDEAARKQRTCERLNKDLKRIQDNQRAGGNSSSMDNLRQQQREVSDSLRAAGC